MSDFAIKTIDVLYLRRHGHLIAVGLTEDELYTVAPSLRTDYDKQVVTVPERVGIAHGEVCDWTKRGGHSFKAKLHWNCPQCGQQWWEDFAGDLANPHFASSGCTCADHWLVHWDSSQATGELTIG